MKVVIPGGSGQIGGLLARTFARDGHEVTILGRSPDADRAGSARRVHWDGVTVGPWAEELDGADVVVNLAGRSVDCRYDASNRKAIMDSRVASTRAVGRAIAACAEPPPTWLQASTTTIYAHRYDAPNDERTGVLGGDERGVPETWRFSIEVARAWEQALEDADTPGTRKVALRSAMVMSPERGGVFDVLLGLVRRGLGGAAGDGRQYVSWIHHEDFTRAVAWLIEHDDIAGPVNLAAPNPLPNAEFMRALRQAWGIGFGLPASDGCSRRARSSCEPRPSSSSRAAASCRAGSPTPASHSASRGGRRQHATSASSGASCTAAERSRTRPDRRGRRYGLPRAEKTGLSGLPFL